MKENWEDCFARVLKHEGGFVNHPKDPGGMTNLGVTKANWEAFLGRDVSEADMRALTPDSVKPFYKAMYWDKMRCDDLPSGVDYAAYDFAVNSGVGRSAKYLQRIAGVTDDGVIGNKSVEAICAYDPAQMVNDLCDMRLTFLKSLSNFATFGRGWESRVHDVAEIGSDMTKEA
jgi:lysozyme family protein